MDCAAEEQLVRLALDGLPNIQKLDFDLNTRVLSVYHTGRSEPIFQALNDLDLGTSFGGSVPTGNIVETEVHGRERRVLWAVLSINFFFFALEVTTGFIAGSMGLVADSLDMLADCMVFGLSLFAVGGTINRKKRVAEASGYLQLTLALFGLFEVVRRFLGYGEVPEYRVMIVVSALALAGNAVSLYILRKSKNSEAHMQASYIFLSNDVVINIGVIVAGALVFLARSVLPDLVIGTLIFLLVARGAFRILRLAR
jgi:Co/Zn/Cd efflux system component